MENNFKKFFFRIINIFSYFRHISHIIFLDKQQVSEIIGDYLLSFTCQKLLRPQMKNLNLNLNDLFNVDLGIL